MIKKCTTSPSVPAKAELLVIGLFQGELDVMGSLELGQETVSWFSDECERCDFKAEKKQKLEFSPISGLKILVVGLGQRDDMEPEDRLALGAMATRTAREHKMKQGCLIFADGFPDHESLTDVSCGLYLGDYRFERYQTQNTAPESFQTWTLQHDNKASASLKKAKALSEGICRARDWVNEPGNRLTPVVLGQQAQEMAEEKGLKIKVLGPKEIAKARMKLFLSVSDGSTANPPALIHVEYKPKKKSTRKVFLVGKGVTFDSGGLSLKPPKSMMTMKCDMGGAAAVLGAMSAIADLKPDVEVHAVVAATENMADGSATRPGDVVESRSGKTVEILNTDAEGRLTLADALSYSVDQKATEVIDLATLTGACMVALGPHMAALYSDDDELQHGLLEAASKSSEEIWPMPLSKKLKASIKSPIADLKNIGGPHGGSITAALFLQEFVGETPWAHLDIAGPAFSESDSAYGIKGGSGYGVRTLVEYLCS